MRQAYRLVAAHIAKAAIQSSYKAMHWRDVPAFYNDLGRCAAGSGWINAIGGGDCAALVVLALCKRIGHLGGGCFKVLMQERIFRIDTFDPHKLSKPLSRAHQDVVETTRLWLDQMVVGLNLCPFSSSVIARDQVRYAVCDATNDDDLTQFYVTELQRLLGTNEHEIATSLLMFTQGLTEFDAYLDALDWFQQLLEEVDLTEHVQLASFHPQYQFEGVAADDLSHFTNRSPYPTIHLLRQDQMSKVLAHVGDPEKIFLDNIETMKKLGRRKVEALCPWGV